MVPIKMLNAFHVRDMDRNLISYAKITDKHKTSFVGNIENVLDKDSKSIAITRKEGRLYKMMSAIYKDEVKVNIMISNKNGMTAKEKTHRKLSRLNYNYLNMLYKHQLLEGKPENYNPNLKNVKSVLKI